MKEIIRAFNPSLDEDSLNLVQTVYECETNARLGRELLQRLEQEIIRGNSDIKRRCEELQVKLNTALFGNKKFINESYAFEIPLTEHYFKEPERVHFKDNTLTTKLSQDGTKSKIDLKPTNIVSRKGTDFKFIGKSLHLEKNPSHAYQELEVILPKEVVSGHLYIRLDKYDNISVLNTYGRELLDKTITNTVSQVITKDTKSVILRFHNNKKKTFVLEDFYVTKENFSLVSEVESKPIKIGYTLSQIGINTCDNYSDDSIDISYKLSVNGGEYKEIRPLNKQKNINLNSILSVDTQEHYFELTDFSTIHDKFLFHTESITIPEFEVIRGFNLKLGVDEGLIRNRPIYLNCKEDTSIILHTDEKIEINNTEIQATKDNTEVPLKKGFNKIVANFQETENLLGKTDISISEGVMTYTLKGKKYNKLIDFNPNVKGKSSLVYQLITKGDIYLEPTKVTKRYVNNVLYLEKEHRLKNLHLFVKSKSLFVDTVQLKISLKSDSKNNPAFISSLTIRGTK